MLCVSKKEAGKILGVGLRMVTTYLQRGKLNADHKEGKFIMIPIDEVYNLREEIRNKNTRKRG